MLTDEILELWFAGMDSEGNVPEEQRKKWWQKNPEFDAELSRRFKAAHQRAIQGEYASMLAQPQSCLALIILVDQFSRQIFRDTPQAFANDHLSRQWCIDGLDKQYDQQLLPIQRCFFYMPLMHSENLDDQNHCVQLFTDLVAGVPDDQQQQFKGNLDFATRHRDVIAEFGRFPHRNQILQRTSTLAEQQYLQQPDAGF